MEEEEEVVNEVGLQAYTVGDATDNVLGAKVRMGGIAKEVDGDEDGEDSDCVENLLDVIADITQ